MVDTSFLQKMYDHHARQTEQKKKFQAIYAEVIKDRPKRVLQICVTCHQKHSTLGRSKVNDVYCAKCNTNMGRVPSTAR